MSTRSLFVLVLAMVLGIALSVRWYLDLESSPRDSLRPSWAQAQGTHGGELVAPRTLAASPSNAREAHGAPLPEAAQECTKRLAQPQPVQPPQCAPIEASAAAATALQSTAESGLDAL